MASFDLQTDLTPQGDQGQAIESLVGGLEQNLGHQTLLGVTGSGKTFTIANVISRVDCPALIISHNKTLAAQLYAEFHRFFPNNAVEYFVSYYDYYQPEAYIPSTDVYIEKDASINEDIDRLRLSATASLMSRRDVIIIASVSSIYGLGSPDAAREMMLFLEKGQPVQPVEIMKRLVEIQYTRGDFEFMRGRYRYRGDAIEIWPAASESSAVRIEFPFDEIELIQEINPLTGDIVREMDQVAIYPAKHYILPRGSIQAALASIERELEQRVAELRRQGKLLEAQRLDTRTRYDMELLEELGYCNGIENYSRHLEGRPAGTRPYCLFDFLPPDTILIVDESHVTIPQFGGMYHGDRSRKQTLVEHGFRLPSALDNRPMTFDEFQVVGLRRIYMSATPAAYEIEKSNGRVIEQIIRPTGLVDPPIEIRPTKNQVQDLFREIEKHTARGQRVLVNALTKRMSENLASYFAEAGLKTRYLHSDIDAIQRVEILRDLRKGEFDVLVGVNLLREGLDLPEVALVAIMDADKKGFLRSRTSLMQTIGRAARNVDGAVIFYADVISDAMAQTIAECERRREKQLAYNAEHGITPTTIQSNITAGIEELVRRNREAETIANRPLSPAVADVAELINALEIQMLDLAEKLKFEEAAVIRDQIDALKNGELIFPAKPKRGARRHKKKSGVPTPRIKKHRKKKI